MMRIRFRKISNERHALEIVREDGRSESAEFETKSVLIHDFLHYAVESAAGLTDGFWGALAAGKMMENFRNNASAQGETLPPWLTEALILDVQERMRKLIGHWNATEFGKTMEIEWS